MYNGAGWAGEWHAISGVGQGLAMEMGGPVDGVQWRQMVRPVDLCMLGTTVHRPIRVHCSPFLGPPVCDGQASTGPSVCIADPSSAHPSALRTMPRPTRVQWTGIHRPIRLPGTPNHRPIRLYCPPCLGPPVCHGSASTGPSNYLGHPTTGPSMCIADPGSAHPSALDNRPPAHPSALPTMPWPTRVQWRGIHRPIRLPGTPNRRPIRLHCSP